jgi:hypothetical protein
MAFGTLKADTLTHSTAGSLTTDYVVNGSAKAWFQITGVGTAALKDSLNVSSFNDEGTGNYKITYSNNMANTTYSFSTGAGWDVGGTNSTYSGTDKDEILTSTLEIYHVNTSDSSTDANLSMGSIHGDLA